MTIKNPHQRELAGAVSFGRDAKPFTTETRANPTIIVDRHVVIGRGDGGQFLVTVFPPTATHGPKLFDNLKSARGYAGGLRMVHRWAVHEDLGGRNG